MRLTINQALRQAIVAHEAGRVQDAERLYRAILQSQPLHPDANHNLGVLAASLNKTDMALPLFEAALNSNPKIKQFWVSYIEALIKEKSFDNIKKTLRKARKHGVHPEKLVFFEKQLASAKEKKNRSGKNPPKRQIQTLLSYFRSRRFKEAEELADSLTKEFSKHQVGWKVLGVLLDQANKNSQALLANQRSVELNYHDAEAHYNLGNTLQKLARFEYAEASYRQAIAINPKFAEAHNNLGNMLQEHGKLEESEEFLAKAIILKPDFTEAHYNLGITLIKLERFEEAVESFKRSIALKPDHFKAQSGLGDAMHKLCRFEEAEAYQRRAIGINPTYSNAYNNLALILEDAGRLDEAKSNYSKAVDLDAAPHEFFRNLSRVKKFTGQDCHYVKMLELYDSESASDEQRCEISFALAKACEDTENFEQAFRYYAEGNKLRKGLLNYDKKQDEELFSQIKLAYPQIEQNALKAEKVSKNLIPVFIVGMPRSGTTLVEQIISSHSQVTGAGELIFANHFGSRLSLGLSKIGGTSMLNFRKNYLNKLLSVSNGNLIVTDKMPHNFLLTGLLAAALPEAKIIHVKREAAAVCWANYRMYFTSKKLGYCYAIDDVINYYKLYENLMEFWEASLKSRIYNLNYEQLTVSHESETRQLIDYLDLDWDDKCLSPQDNVRSVTTASNLQVRESIYQGSSKKWKKYEPFLNGAFEQFAK